jgi:hypothetical protein
MSNPAKDPSLETPTVAVTLRWEGAELFAGNLCVGAYVQLDINSFCVTWMFQGKSLFVATEAEARAALLAAAVKALSDA